MESTCLSLWVISEALCKVAAPCSASYDVCGGSGTAASVTKVHCLCDVYCCLAMNQEGLQGSFLQRDMRTLIKFHVLLGKSALECCKSLKEGSGTHVLLYETVCRWVSAI